uniref:Uncharacterized protein n=1 Tax=Pararge aegeria TaxID=116150 RepID=S4PC42_9NEOP
MQGDDPIAARLRAPLPIVTQTTTQLRGRHKTDSSRSLHCVLFLTLISTLRLLLTLLGTLTLVDLQYVLTPLETSLTLLDMLSHGHRQTRS